MFFIAYSYVSRIDGSPVLTRHVRVRHGEDKVFEIFGIGSERPLKHYLTFSQKKNTTNQALPAR
jgi:hypothetical protein